MIPWPVLRLLLALIALCCSGLTVRSLTASTAATAAFPNHALMQISGGGDQATLGEGECVALGLQVRSEGSTEYVDRTQDPNTRFFTDPPRGTFTAPNVWCAPVAQAEQDEVTIYGRYQDPETGVSVTDTVVIRLRPREVPPPPPPPPPTGRVSGRVFDTNTGSCVPSVVSLRGLDGTEVASQAIDCVTAAGYSFAGLTPGRYVVTVRPTGSSEFTPTSVELTIPDGGAELERDLAVTLAGSSVGSARVSGEARLDQNGDGELGPGEPPVAGLRVTLLNAGRREHLDSTFTGGRGEFSFEVQQTGTFIISPDELPGHVTTVAATGNSGLAGAQGTSEIRVTLEPGTDAAGLLFLYRPVSRIERLFRVGDPVPAAGRLNLLHPDASDLDDSTVRSVGGDGSLVLMDHSGTSLLRLPRRRDDPAEVLLDTTGRAIPGSAGLARLEHVAISRDGIGAVLATRSDNTRAVYRLENRRLSLVSGLPANEEGTVEPLAIADGGEIAYVAPAQSGAGPAAPAPLTLFQTTEGRPVELLRQGQALPLLPGIGGATLESFTDLSANPAGDLAFRVTLRLPNGSRSQAVLRSRSGVLEIVAVTGQAVLLDRRGSRAGRLLELRQPLIGPEGSVVFLGIGDGGVNFFVARPGRPLEPMLVGSDWYPDIEFFNYDISESGAIAVRAAARPSTDVGLYLVAPTGGVTLVAGGRPDLQPVGRPAFGAGGRLFFLAENRTLPRDRNGRYPVGLYRFHSGVTGLVAVALPGQPLPGRPGTRLLSVTQRPAVANGSVLIAVQFTGPDGGSVPTADLVRIPLDGLLANGELVEAEGRPITDAGRVAFLRDLSYTGDGTLVFGLLLPGGGPLIATITAPATTAGAARTQAVRQARLRVLLPPRGNLPGPGELVDALPPLLALGPHRLLFFAGLSRGGLNEEGLFAIDPSQPTDPIPAEPVAVTRMTAPSGGVYDSFSDTTEYLLNPPSVFSDSQGENVVFRSRLRGSSGSFGVFQWTGSGAPTAVRLSGDPNQVRRWEAGGSRLVYLLAREAGGRSSLLRRRAPGAPLEPLPGAAALTALEDFVLTRDGSLFAFGADAAGPGLFRVDGAAPGRVPGVGQGVPLPAFADGTPARGAFDLVPGAGESESRVALQPDSRRGVLHFTAGLVSNGSRLKGLFRYDPARGRVETMAVESLDTTSRNNVTVTTLNSLGDFRQTSNAWTAYAVQQGGLWQIVRARTITNRSGTRIDNEVIVREGLRLEDGQTLQTLDAHAVLRAQGRSDRQGPVFALSDTGDVAFWASDGTTWGLYQVRAPGP